MASAAAELRHWHGAVWCIAVWCRPKNAPHRTQCGDISFRRDWRFYVDCNTRVLFGASGGLVEVIDIIPCIS